ncbi:two-component system response regulator [Catenovulum sediminis]|uniref:EAL domain-containing protein n=1 Tax=Catenovulum sediminis TaxID=1740262 RepID=A0ABV1RGK4_9ALTE|nr:GGDEF domain-containing response regulator [Catenovulum sediminis]
MRILLVNHSELHVKGILEQCSATQEHTFLIVEDGEQALFQLMRVQFDIVIVSLVLPDIDAPSLMQLNNGRAGTNTAFIIVADDFDQKLVSWCLQKGADDVVKPTEVTPTLLNKALARKLYNMSVISDFSNSFVKSTDLSQTDKLTQLHNREYFLSSLTSAIPRAKRYNIKLALMVIDIDNFKSCNEHYGFETGDMYLQQVAQDMNRLSREGDLICYLGGDEFAILAYKLDSSAALHRFVRRLLDVFNAPRECAQHQIELTASLGIAQFPESANEPQELLKCAEIAMYRAKVAGKNQFSYYSSELHAHVSKRLLIENTLPAAMKEGQFVLHYQPIVVLEPYKVAGVEALVRWQHPELGLLYPEAFISIAEDLDKIIKLGNWVMEAAFTQLQQWRKSELVDDTFCMAINVSVHQLLSSHFVESFFAYLKKYDIAPSCVELEIVESVLIRDFVRLKDNLTLLINAGVSLAVDDFGTGYSSLAYLRDLPVNTLKVDKSFLLGLPGESRGCRLLKALINIAKSLEMKVVVEGVENVEQAKLCLQYKAEKVQGFYFSKPLVSSDELDKVIHANFKPDIKGVGNGQS